MRTPTPTGVPTSSPAPGEYNYIPYSPVEPGDDTIDIDENIPGGPTHDSDPLIDIDDDIPGGPTRDRERIVDIVDEPNPFGPIAKTGQEVPFIPVISGAALLIIAVLILKKK